MSLENALGTITFSMFMELSGMFLSGRDGLMYDTRITIGPHRFYSFGIYQLAALILAGCIGLAQYLYGSDDNDHYNTVTFILFLFHRLFVLLFWMITLNQKDDPMEKDIPPDEKTKRFNRNRRRFIIGTVPICITCILNLINFILYIIDGKIVVIILQVLYIVWLTILTFSTIRGIMLSENAEGHFDSNVSRSKEYKRVDDNDDEDYSSNEDDIEDQQRITIEPQHQQQQKTTKILSSTSSSLSKPIIIEKKTRK